MDNEWNVFDPKTLKAHQHASGAAKSTKEALAMGKPAVRSTNEIQMLGDPNGNPVHIGLSAQVHDSS